MSAVERLETEATETPSIEADLIEAAGEKPREAAAVAGACALCGALSRPGGAALVALIVAALTTLVVPLAVRRMIDFGLTPRASS